MQEVVDQPKVFLRLRVYPNGWFMIQSPFTRGNTFIPKTEWVGAIIELKNLWSIPYFRCKHPDGYWVFPPTVMIQRDGIDVVKQDIIDVFKLQGWDVTILGPAAIADDFEGQDLLS